jgi:hypothetical protein
MKGFKNSTHMQSGHNFAKGGHVPRPHFAQAHPVSPKPSNGDVVNGLTARTPDMDGNSAQKRSVPSTELDSDHGGKSTVNSGYAGGGKVVHVHQHYHNGKRMPSARQIAKKRASAEKGLISSGTAGVKLGKNAISNSKGTPSIRSNFKKGGRATGGTIDKVATGGTINKMATGGTQNKLNCGGAMYAEGGGVKAALREHVDSPAPRGHKGLGSMIRRGG